MAQGNKILKDRDNTLTELQYQVLSAITNQTPMGNDTYEVSWGKIFAQNNFNPQSTQYAVNQLVRKGYIKIVGKKKFALKKPTLVEVMKEYNPPQEDEAKPEIFPKNCLNCGKELTNRLQRKFCSKDCRYEYNHPNVDTTPPPQKKNCNNTRHG